MDRKRFERLVEQALARLPEVFRATLLHELGHFFGLGEDDLRNV
jgi:predicted Zn-dependent protease with MMP-like domain